MSAKIKYPADKALAVAKILIRELKPYTSRIEVAGSLRRGRDQVGDVEILYVPKMTPGVRVDFFAEPTPIDATEKPIEQLLKSGVLEKRINVSGSVSWGKQNKFAKHVASGIPVDLFSTSEESWFNYLVCRTGGAENNKAICEEANKKGWKWNPYDIGFEKVDFDGNPTGQKSERMDSEESVYAFVGMDYPQPWQRL